MVSLFSLFLVVQADIPIFSNAFTTPIEIPVYMLTTRESGDSAKGVEGESGYNNKYPLGDIN